MPLTETERAEVRMYVGWSARFFQFDVALEQAMNAIDDASKVDTLALIQNTLTGTPPGLLASLRDVDSKIVLAHNNLKADKVGSILLNRMEIKQLYLDGKRFVARLATILGIEVLQDIFSGRLPRMRASRGGVYLAHG